MLEIILIVGIFLFLGGIFLYLHIKKEKRIRNIIKTYNIIQVNHLSFEEWIVFSEININRKTHDLLTDEKTFELARRRCKEIYQQDLESGGISHNGVGDEFGELIDLGADEVSECLGKGYRSPHSFVEALLKSDKHRKAILSDKFDWCGIGLYIDYEINTYYWCVLLAGDND